MKWLWFVAATVLFWGMYVPTIHKGQAGFGSMNSALRAFLFIGLAYFVMAGVVLGYALLSGSEPMQFTARGVTLSFLAGLLGALGALGIVFAIKTGGKPLEVAPLVFAGAPVMSTFVAMLWDRPGRPPGVWFFAGIILVALGAFLVLRHRPMDDKKHGSPARVESRADSGDLKLP
jgi:drug/metabolite transporter (DMT)-like permease